MRVVPDAAPPCDKTCVDGRYLASPPLLAPLPARRGLCGSSGDDSEPAEVAHAFADGDAPTFLRLLERARAPRCDVIVKPEQVRVPVFLTLMVKRLEDRAGQTFFTGTMIQRTLFFDLSQTTPDRSAGFHVRLHETDRTQSFQVRKSVTAPLYRGGEPTQYKALCVTSSFSLPARLRTVFSHYPLNITAAELDLELTSFVGSLADSGGELFEFRPDLVCHIGDLSNLVCVRDWKSIKDFDAMRDFDVLSVNPTVQYKLTRKARDGAPPADYVSAVRVSFYMHKDGLQAYLTTILPLIFAALGNGLNMRYAASGLYDTNGFLSKALFTGVLAINVTKAIGPGHGTSHEFNAVKVLSGLLFTGLVVGLRGNVDVSCEIVSNVCTWSAILLQFSGLLAYVARKRKLRDMYKTDVAKPWDFLGSPPNDQTSTGKTIHGAHVDLDRVTPFWELRDGRADLSSRLRHVPGWDKQPWNQARSARGLLEEVYAGPRPDDV